MSQPDITTEEALRWTHQGGIKVGVPIADAIEAYRQEPNDLTLRTVFLAQIVDQAAGKLQYDCLAGARLEHWHNRSCGDHTPEEIRRDSLAMVTWTISRLADN